MTTPQNELYMLSDRIKRLTDMFEPQLDENDEYSEKSLFDKVDYVYLELTSIVKQLDTLENQMALIIKLLSKDAE